MPSFPLPLFSSAVLAFLLLRMWMTERQFGPLGALLVVCMIQGVIIAMAQHYHVPGAQPLQALVATTIPPLAWFAFWTTAVRPAQTGDALHGLGPLNAIVFMISAPAFLDILIPGLFLGYGIAVLWQCRKGPDALPRLRLDAGSIPLRVWQIIGAALIGSAFADLMIICVRILGLAQWQPWIISVYSAISLLTIGTLSLASQVQTVPDTARPAPQIDPENDAAIMAKLQGLMDRDHPYLNPDLTLAQLSRKLLVPVKQLSGAVNRVTGENTSKFINAARIRAAQKSMQAGENVTNAMLASGFNTKSNFNREFLRQTGQSPSDWMANQSRLLDGPV